MGCLVDLARFAFDSTLFLRAIDVSRSSSIEVAERLSDLDLYEAVLGRYIPLILKHSASLSGKLFHLSSKPVEPWNG